MDGILKTKRSVPQRISVCLLLTALLLTAFVPPASGKGLTTNPPVAITIIKNYTSLGINPPVIGSDEVSAITAAIGNLGALYDSTWRPAIHSLIVNNSRSLDGAYVDGIGVALYPAVSGFGIQTQYAYKASIDALPGNSYFRDLTISDPVLKKLTMLDLSLYLRFGLSGLYINDRTFLDEFFSATDGYMHRLVQFTPQLVSVASTQLPGKAFGGLDISLLDANVVRISAHFISGDLAYSEYSAQLRWPRLL